MITDEKVEKALNYLQASAPKIAQAKANLDYVDEFKKVLKAQIMKEHPKESAAGQEREAYADPRYKQHLEAVKEATYEFVHLQFMAKAAEATIEAWRTQSSNERAARI
jgi:hypothetical protein